MSRRELDPRCWFCHSVSSTLPDAPLRDLVLSGYVLLSTPWVAMAMPIVENEPVRHAPSSEVYSAPRVSAAAGCLPKYGLMSGLAFDITVDDDTGQPYDFSVKTQGDEAEALLDAQKPVLLIGSPMCTAFSVIQAIIKAQRDPAIVERELVAGRLHLAWCCQLYRKHISRGAFYLHEHPAGATSWTEWCLLQLLAMSGVRRI